MFTSVEIQRKKKELSNENNRMKNDITRYERQLSEFQEENETLETALKEATKSLESFDKKVELLELDRFGLEQVREQSINERDDIEQTLNRTKKKFEKKCDEVDKFENELNNLTNKYNDIEKQSKIKEEQYKEIGKVRHELHAENLDLHERLIEGKKELNKYKRESQSLAVQKDNLETEQERTTADYIESKNVIELMQREREKICNENVELKETLSKQRETLNSKSKERRQFEESVMELKRSLVQFERDGEYLRKDNARLKNENQQTSSKLARMQDETLREITEKYAETIKLRAELDAVKNELEKRNRYLENQISITSEYDYVTMEISYKEEIRVLKEQIERSSYEEANVKSQLNLTKNKFNIYLKDRSRLEDEVKELTFEAERQRTIYSKYEKEVKTKYEKVEREKKITQRKFENICGEQENRVAFLELGIQSIKASHMLENEAKKVEIESLKRQIKLKNSENLRNQAIETDSTNQREILKLEEELREIKDKYKLKSHLYEKDLEYLNLKYALAVEQSKDGNQTNISNIIENMKMTEKEKKCLQTKWEEKFTSYR